MDRAQIPAPPPSPEPHTTIVGHREPSPHHFPFAEGHGHRARPTAVAPGHNGSKAVICSCDHLIYLSRSLDFSDEIEEK
jgi:hypothetical protein